MHSALAVANHLFERAQQARLSLTGGQLQCLCYFAHGLRLALVNLPLLDEAVLADRDGISIASITRLGLHGSRPVPQLLTEVRPTAGGLLDEVAPVLDEQEPALSTVDLVWSRFGRFSAYDLGVFVRSAGGPWDETWNHPDRVDGQLHSVASQPLAADGRALPIANSLIRRWFRELTIQENRDQASADGLAPTVMARHARPEDTLSLAAVKKLRAP
jgi:uncharacterized phage-associated protein